MDGLEASENTLLFGPARVEERSDCLSGEDGVGGRAVRKEVAVRAVAPVHD